MAKWSVKMKVVNWTAYTLLLAGQASAGESGCRFITGEVFKQRIESKDEMFVAFVAPKDELSIALLPEWTEIQEYSDLAVTVNCTIVPVVCREANVSSLPAIRLYQSDGGMTRYRGPKKAPDIAAFIERMSRPVITDLKDGEMDEFSVIDDLVVLGLLSEKDVSLRADFGDVATKFRDRYTFGVYTLPTEDLNNPSQVICRNNLDDLEHKITDFTRVDSLERLLEQCAAPLIMPLNRRTELVFNKIAKSPVYYFSDDEEDIQMYVDIVRPIAKLFKEYLVFATVDTNEYAHMPGMFGLSNKGLCLQVLQNGQIYHFGEGEMSAAAVQRFIETVSGGKAQPWDGKIGGNQHDEL